MPSRKATAVVIDVGSLSVRAGFALDNCPRVVFPTIDPVRQRHNNNEHNSYRSSNSNSNSNDGVINCNDGVDKKDKVKHPVVRGYITTQWDSMEDIWHHAFYKELRVKPESQPVLVTEPPLNPKAARERTVQILFDTFNVPALYVFVAPVLALYSTGRDTGCVVDSGHGVTHIVSVYEGYHLPHATKRIDIAGRDITEYLAQNVLPNLKLSANTDLLTMARVVKESGVCYVATDFSTEIEKPDHELLANQSVSESITNLEIGKEAFRCTEILFQPNAVSLAPSGSNSSEQYGQQQDQKLGVVQATFQCMIDACGKNNEFEIFHLLCSNIVLTGGNTLFPGFTERFTADMEGLVSRRLRVKIIAPETRKFDIWRGGSILASLSEFESNWITQEEYENDGPTCIYKNGIY